MAVPEGRKSLYIIRSERTSWLLLVVGIVCTAVSLGLSFADGAVGVYEVLRTVILAAVSIYAGACVVWHRRHRAKARAANSDSATPEAERPTSSITSARRCAPARTRHGRRSSRPT